MCYSMNTRPTLPYILIFLSGLLNIALANTPDVTVSGTAVPNTITLTVALLIQIVSFSVFVGKTLQQMKTTNEGLNSIGRKYDDMIRVVQEMKEDMKGTCVKVEEVVHRLDRVEKKQDLCKFAGRDPDSFVQK